MVDVVLSVVRVLAALFLVFLNGFFVAAEFAFVRIRATSVQRLVEEERAGAPLLQEVMENLDDYLATTQLGITIASLGLGWIGEPAIAALLEPVLEPVLPASAIHLVAFAVGFSVITFLHVVFGELAPKTIAIAEAERLSLIVAPPMKLFYYLFVPGIVVFNGTANFFTGLLGVSPASESDETLEEEEIRHVLARSGRQGHVDMAKVEMIERVFDLDETAVREVMVPRPDVVVVEADWSLDDVRQVVLDEKHTRYPVVDAEEPDRVVGFVDVKDVMAASEASTDEAATVTAGDLARDVAVVPESTRINDVLLEFQSEQTQMAVVIDEWGAFEGIATVEDVVEAIVGDIRDEFDVDEREPSIDERPDGTYDVDGSVPISRLNDVLGTEFASADFETVGGLVLARLGRAPEAGDEVRIDGYRLTVEAVDGTRISSVVVGEADTDSDEADADTDTDADTDA
ncbi:hemolysin family protein [Haloarchaeobius sp. HRN-SO-5]|uniref:hemolysin family protein n=1 Tax=Haloarchaeobius sp. HRN-SO-5 TaxID=3446118 RepID=UPI003EC15007